VETTDGEFGRHILGRRGRARINFGRGDHLQPQTVGIEEGEDLVPEALLDGQGGDIQLREPLQPERQGGGGHGVGRGVGLAVTGTPPAQPGQGENVSTVPGEPV
jgi:hypothetical protein